MRIKACVSLLSLLLAPAMLDGANGPPPVQVQGTVDVINDVLRTPYARTDFGGGAKVDQVNFDVPAGKRLVVEVVTLELFHNPTEGFFVTLNTITPEGNAVVSTPLSFITRPFNSTHSVSTGVHPITVRVDGRTGSSSELSFELIRTAGGGSFTVSVRGYLVDIPPN
jgi:hypothetical protein